MSTPTVPAGLAASNLTSSSLTLSWEQSRNPGTSMTSGPSSGAWFGWGTADGSKLALLAAESVLGRSVDFYRADYRMNGRPKQSFPTADDRVLYSGGKLSNGQMVAGGRMALWSLSTKVGNGRNPEHTGLLENVTPIGSSASQGGKGVNNVYKYTQITDGALDAYWTSEFTRVADWGMPAWFCFEPVVDGNSRATGSGGGGGSNNDLAAAGTLAEFVAAWAYLRVLASDAGATNLAWLLSFGDGDKALSVYQAAYPGDDQVDWFGWNPTNAPAPGGSWLDFSNTANENTILTVTTAAIATGAAAKPIMLAAYGSVYDPIQADHRASWIAGIPTAASGFAAVKAYVYANYNSTALDVQTYADSTWTDTGTADTDAWAAMAEVADDSYFKQPHSEGGTGVAGYNIYVDDSITAGTDGETATSVDITGFSSGSRHTFQVTALDTAESPTESAKSAALAVTFADVEPIAPTVPTDLAGVPVSSTQINLTWTQAQSQGSGVGGYRIYRDSALAAEITPGGVTSWAVSGLIESTSYTFTIQAGDSTLGVWSSLTAGVTVETLATADITPPDTPTGFTGTVSLPFGTNAPIVILVWSGSPTLVAGYNIYRDGTRIAQVGASTDRYEDSTGLRPSSSYDYELGVYDGAKNESALASTTVITPPPSSTAPLAVLSVSPATGSAPLAVTADASASADPQGQQLTYAFDFGDVPSAGPIRYSASSNKFLTPGDYTVKVTVTNGAGYTDTVSTVVSVAAAVDRTSGLNLYLPRPGDSLVGPGGKAFWDQIRADLRAIDDAISDLRAQ